VRGLRQEVVPPEDDGVATHTSPPSYHLDSYEDISLRGAILSEEVAVATEESKDPFLRDHPFDGDLTATRQLLDSSRHLLLQGIYALAGHSRDR